MTTLDSLLKELEQAPESLRRQVLDFLRFLKSRPRTAPPETALASEASLAKDWLKPEEDAAWPDL